MEFSMGYTSRIRSRKRITIVVVYTYRVRTYIGSLTTLLACREYQDRQLWSRTAPENMRWSTIRLTHAAALVVHGLNAVDNVYL